MAGVLIENDQPIIRGLQGQYVQVLLNGTPVPSTDPTMTAHVRTSQRVTTDAFRFSLMFAVHDAVEPALPIETRRQR